MLTFLVKPVTPLALNALALQRLNVLLVLQINYWTPATDALISVYPINIEKLIYHANLAMVAA